MHWYWCTATLYRKSGIWSGGIYSTRDRGMWKFATRARSSEVAVESQCRAIGSRGTHVFAHSSINSAFHAPHCTSRVCAVPWCVDPRKARGCVDFLHGGIHPFHHTFPHTHCSHSLQRCAFNGAAKLPSEPPPEWHVGALPRSTFLPAWVPPCLPHLCYAAHLVCMVSMGARFPWKPTSRKGCSPYVLGFLRRPRLTFFPVA